MTEKHKAGTLGTTLHELKSGTFLANARARSTRRKSPWNLLLFLVVPLWGLLFVEGIKLARMVAIVLLQGRSMPDDLTWLGVIAPLFAYLPMVIATMLAAMVLINYAVYFFIPPARRAMDAEDKAYPGTEYATQQPLLVRLMLFTLPFAFILAIVGELFL